MSLAEVLSYGGLCPCHAQRPPAEPPPPPAQATVGGSRVSGVSPGLHMLAEGPGISFLPTQVRPGWGTMAVERLCPNDATVLTSTLTAGFGSSWALCLRDLLGHRPLATVPQTKLRVGGRRGTWTREDETSR